MSNEVRDLLNALSRGETTLDDVAQKFRERRWPGRERPSPATAADLARAELEDPEPYVPGSFDDVNAAYHRGELSDHQYDVLARAMAESKNAEDPDT
jgi:hypothetical protein